MSIDNITPLRIVPQTTGPDTSVADCLTAAMGEGLSSVVICGRKDDGTLQIAGNLDDAHALMLLEQCKTMLVLGSMEDDE